MLLVLLLRILSLEIEKLIVHVSVGEFDAAFEKAVCGTHPKCT